MHTRTASPVELIDRVFDLAEQCGGLAELKRLVDRIAAARMGGVGCRVVPLPPCSAPPSPRSHVAEGYVPFAGARCANRAIAAAKIWKSPAGANLVIVK